MIRDTLGWMKRIEETLNSMPLPFSEQSYWAITTALLVTIATILVDILDAVRSLSGERVVQD